MTPLQGGTGEPKVRVVEVAPAAPTPTMYERMNLQKLLALRKFGQDTNAGDKWTDKDGTPDCLAYLFERYEELARSPENLAREEGERVSINYQNPTPLELDAILLGMDAVRAKEVGREAA